MDHPEYPMAVQLDDPSQLFGFILYLYDNPQKLQTYSDLTYDERLTFIDGSPYTINDPMHRHALAAGDAARLHLALTHNLGQQVHAIDYQIVIMQKDGGP